MCTDLAQICLQPTTMIFSKLLDHLLLLVLQYQEYDLNTSILIMLAMVQSIMYGELLKVQAQQIHLSGHNLKKYVYDGTLDIIQVQITGDFDLL